MEKANMKMVVAIMQDEDRTRLSNLLVERGFRATLLSSSGSFLRAGNTTILIGVEERRLEELLNLIQSSAPGHKSISSPSSPMHLINATKDPSEEITIGGATVFVIDAERFIRF